MQNKISIIYEDDFIVVVNKPSGVPTHMLANSEKGTVVNFLLERFPSIKGVGTSELMSGVAHRLDTDTSGIILAVKDNECFLDLRRQFKEQKVLKEYLALVHGIYKGPKDISGFIAPDPKSKKKVKVCSSKTKGGREAITEILSKRNFGNYTLLRLKIKTGMRHQIRVHLANLGYPLVGDMLYQNLKAKQKDQLGLRHHFLHACKIGFFHPRTNKWVEFESKLTEELNEVLGRIPKPR